MIINYLFSYFLTYKFNLFLLHLLFRFERLKTKDNDFDFRFANLGNLGVRNGVTEFNWDSNLDDASTEQQR